MSVELRPMNLGEILDRTIQIYRMHFLMFVAVAAGPSVVLLACLAAAIPMVALASKGGSDNNILVGLGFMGLILVGLPLYAMACSLGYAALTVAARKRYFNEPVTVRGAYREAWGHFGRYVGLFALEMVALGVAPGILLFAGGVGMGIAAAATGGANTAGVFVGFTILGLMAVLAVYELWMLPRLCLAFAVSVSEEMSPWNALKRGWRLSEGTRWRILLLFVLGGVAGSMVSWVFTIPAVVIISLLPSLSGPQNAQMAETIMLFVTYGASFAIQALIRPVYGVGLMLFYYDQRIRKEGFDIEHMMLAAGWGELAAGVPANAAVDAAGHAEAGQA